MLTTIINRIKIKLSFFKKIYRCFTKFAPNKEDSLKYIIKSKKKQNKKQDKNIKLILHQKIKDLGIPSISSFMTIAIGVALFWFLSHPQYIPKWALTFFKQLLFYIFGGEIISSLNAWYAFLIGMNENHYQNFITIHTGIGAILIGFTFFVAQSLTDKSDPDRGKVLLYKSSFFPLLTGEILLFFTFLWGDMNIIGIFPIVIFGLIIIWRLGKTINILLKDHELEEAKRQMFFQILQKNFRFRDL